eukprot:scaffold9372_cov23-Tisochrysis_lutea.AAC.1
MAPHSAPLCAVCSSQAIRHGWILPYGRGGVERGEGGVSCSTNVAANVLGEQGHAQSLLSALPRLTSRMAHGDRK